ncbi:hypothetical protein COU76_00950 [Candidatus Peregrinibacteria bacterium CG10_big_fil_rev_8_21_14_0_10_49_10]|nr:MAG: hypothetical protein COU76_00950 [Candidatus Peregrinibacteria bacterium CG10_big_fil_rev_8_21_14_0_10_49_10]
MQNTSTRKAKEYFAALRPEQTPENIGSIVIAHFLPGKKQFIDAVNNVAPVQAAIPKPSSVRHQELMAVSTDYNVQTLTREHATPILTKLIKETPDAMRLILIDIGGYFADVLEKEGALVQQKVLGVIEDTRNGDAKYEKLKRPFPVAVTSVASSELKLPEDHNVGKAIVFSVDATARQFETILHGKHCLSIGYGPVGKGIADDLRERHAYVRILDSNPLARIHAAADGYRVRSSKEGLNDFDFIFCATGQGSLGEEDFKNLKDGCFVATATSSDEEFKHDALKNFSNVQIHPNVWEYRDAEDHSFYLINDGKSANFIHDAVVGEFIYLVQGEILKLIPYVYENQERIAKNRIVTLPNRQKKEVAEKWEEFWNTNSN